MPASPLPDSTALEAGIIEDERPSRLSRVQDNVRNLLRNSVFGSVASSPTKSVRTHIAASASSPTIATLRHIQSNQPLRSHPPSPDLEQRPRAAQTRFPVVPSPSELLPSPTESQASPATHNSAELAGFPCPPAGSYQRDVQQMAHQAALFNRQAVAVLDHPDLDNPSMESLSAQKSQRRQQRAWTRRRNGSSSSDSSPGKPKRIARRGANSQGLLCVLATLLLAALVATCEFAIGGCAKAVG